MKTRIMIIFTLMVVATTAMGQGLNFSDQAQKEAKAMAGEGWTVAPYTLPLEQQLEALYTYMSEFDDDNNPVYIVGEGLGSAADYPEARTQAMTIAVHVLYSYLEDPTSMEVSRPVHDQDLGNIKKVIDVSRKTDEGKIEAKITLVAISDVVRDFYKKQMENKK